MGTIERWLRALERRLGMDRRGRTVWVWAIPFATGILSAVVAVVIALPKEASVTVRVVLGVFAFVAMTAMATLYLMSFGGDPNQQPEDGDRH